MPDRYWPLERGRVVTSPFGPRDGGFHYGADFGFPQGSARRPVFAIQAGTVKYVGAAQGYGGPDPAGWIVIDSSTSEGGGCLEYGHIVRLPNIVVGSKVRAGQQIGVINPDSRTNGGTAPHLHLSDMPGEYNPGAKQDPLPRLNGARDPGGALLGKEEPVLNNRPDFNEYPVWSPNKQSRNGTRIDLFLLHTEEGGGVKGAADRLARWLGNPANQVSYHYTVNQDPDDNGVTVCDVVDTDLASWSALSANNRSINLVFAGSRAGWSRDQWMKQSRAIDVAAYLAVQDSKKYGFSAKVIAPPYTLRPPGISDHCFVTRILRDGSHTDVGPNFPWDFFSQCVAKYLGQQAAPPPPAPPAPGKQFPRDFTDRQLLEDIWNTLQSIKKV